MNAINTLKDKKKCKLYSHKVLQISLHWLLNKIRYESFSYANSVYKLEAEESLILRKRIRFA